MSQEYRAPGETEPAVNSFVKPGVIYGYRAIADYGDFSAGQGHVYYFGRTKQRSILSLDVSGEQDLNEDQIYLLRRKLGRTGLNTPSRVLLWVRVDDIDRAWDNFREQLRGWLHQRDGIEGPTPILTNVLSLGDNWFTVENLGPEDFGKWCNAILQKILAQLQVFDSM
jgi:hypothetical protein